MKPYYHDENAGITLYHGDCLEILPTLEAGSVDLLLTDPPYLGLKGGTTFFGNHQRQPTMTVGLPWGENLDGLRLAYEFSGLGGLVFCSYHFVDAMPSLLPGTRRGLICWYKRNSMPVVQNVPWYQTEYIWAVQKAPGLFWRGLRTFYDVPMLSAGWNSSERILNGNYAAHPTQKPVRLMGALLECRPASVIDPYAGTGTTLVACKQRGVRAIGIELEERYCEIAARRLCQEVLPLWEPTSAPAPEPVPSLFAEDAA